MSKMRLTIQHNGVLLEPPVESGVKIEWERTGYPGKMTFTVIKVDSGWVEFVEGDPVCFYYENKPVFAGYIFTKKRTREHKIDITCYDQLRYFKNKYTYLFENKTATQIIQSLAADFKLTTGTMDNTGYVIPTVLHENKSAFDIALDAIEETLTNTGNMFVLYDDCGKLCLKNTANMVSNNLIFEDSAENLDYSSSIDDETYNSVVLYYQEDEDKTDDKANTQTKNKKIQVYSASDQTNMQAWGTLRYFEEVKNKTIAQNKANELLKLYNKKTRELKVTGAFGVPNVRAGTLIPVKLNLGDIQVNNFMLVEKVTHNYEAGHHTMDLTLEGAWE